VADGGASGMGGRDFLGLPRPLLSIGKLSNAEEAKFASDKEISGKVEPICGAREEDRVGGASEDVRERGGAREAARDGGAREAARVGGAREGSFGGGGALAG